MLIDFVPFVFYSVHRGAEYCDERVCVCVSVRVCVFWYSYRAYVLILSFVLSLLAVVGAL